MPMPGPGSCAISNQVPAPGEARRWRLDEVVTHTGKPSEIYYLVKLKKPVTRDDLLTAIRATAGDFIAMADLESRDPSDEDVRAAV